MHWSAKYLGLPWCEHGRDRDGLDCWGLVTLAFGAEKGIPLPSYVEGYETITDIKRLAVLMQDTRAWPWQAVPKGQEQEWDLAVFTRAGFECHVGIVVEPGRVLHISPREDACVASYRRGPLSTRLAGFYRHSDLIES